MVSKEAKLGLLLGLVFIVAIAVVLRGVHKNRGEMLDENLAVNRDIETPAGNENHEELDIPQAASQLTDPWAPLAIEEEGSSQFEDTSRGVGEDNEPETVGEQLPLEQGPTRYEQNLFEILPGTADQEDPFLRIGEPEPPLEGLSYVVRNGDNLWKIAEQELGNPLRNKEIKKLNGLTSDLVIPGQKLRLPEKRSGGSLNTNITAGAGAGMYVVRKDENLWRIAQRELGDPLRYKEIMALNSLATDKVLAGQKLRLPVR